MEGGVYSIGREGGREPMEGGGGGREGGKKERRERRQGGGKGIEGGRGGNQNKAAVLVEIYGLYVHPSWSRIVRCGFSPACECR